ncbi:DUF1127 domain-containing protein [Thiolinea disciformis]|uniref:DUF1127 domain-containing protein n=1 Tax=Thiolinea disciformis TaxID=125614 RepID=UPI00036B6B66|nr:DUF1127 domain-containing protein [Thiolinea disciformis]
MKDIKSLLSNLFSFGANSKSEIRRAVAELQAMNDRELNDLGLSRSDIEYAVIHGRAGIDAPRKAA